MKIAIFSDNFYPELSGIADSVVTLTRELAARGHQIRIYAPRYSAANFAAAKLPVQELDLDPNVSFHRFFSLPFPLAGKQARLVIPSLWLNSDIKKFKPDVIHTQLFWGTGLNALRAAHRLKIPLVGTNHTVISAFMPKLPLVGDWLKRASVRYAAWYYNHCVFVTAPSQIVFDEMEQNGFRRPHRVLSNPLDITTFQSTITEQPFRTSPHTVISAGRLSPEKDIATTLRAMALVIKIIPDAELLIAGGGISKPSLRQLAQQLGISQQIKFLGTLNKPTLATAYHSADVFVITSPSETQSLTLMNAMACALPVIGVRAWALPEYIKEDNGILVEPGDYQALADQLVALLKDPDRRTKLGHAGRVLVEQFSPEKIAQKWEEIYAKAINP